MRSKTSLTNGRLFRIDVPRALPGGGFSAEDRISSGYRHGSTPVLRTTNTPDSSGETSRISRSSSDALYSARTAPSATTISPTALPYVRSCSKYVEMKLSTPWFMPLTGTVCRKRASAASARLSGQSA